MKKRLIIAGCCVTALMLLVSGCDKFTQKKDDANAPQKAESVYAVEVYKITRESMNDYLEFGGDVTPVSTVDIFADTSGKLVNLRVKIGDRVVKDQVIAGVDPSRPGATYSVSPVKAPVSGTITTLPLQEGSTVAPSLSLGKISSTNQLEITLSVPERFVSRIQLDQVAYISFDAYPGQRFTARVSKISPVLDTVTRTMTVTLQLSPADARIKIGMYARVRLITDNRSDVLIVPSAAVVRRGNDVFAFVKNGDSVRRQEITLGIRVDDKQEVISGLQSGDEVVIKGQALLDDGSKINVIGMQTAQGGE